MQDETIQWLSVILGSLLFLDACLWVVPRYVVAGRVGGDTPRRCCRENAPVYSRHPISHHNVRWRDAVRSQQYFDQKPRNGQPSFKRHCSGDTKKTNSEVYFFPVLTSNFLAPFVCFFFLTINFLADLMIGYFFGPPRNEPMRIAEKTFNSCRPVLLFLGTHNN